MFRYIELFYNRKRLHSVLKYMDENKLDYSLEELDEEQIKKIDEKTLNYYEKKDSFLK